jgi:hypothetical protein
MTNIKKILFPFINNKFNNVLNIGYTENKFKKLKHQNEDILVILDVTGSMGDYLNETRDCSKAKAVKNVLTKIESLGYKLDILPFNTIVHSICNIENIPEPNECTFFSPLVSELNKILHKNHSYGSVLFFTDGLPTEDRALAHKSIKTIGTMTRESGANPVSIAVGDDADGPACALFSGNRGYECFLKYLSHIENLVTDIINGINCNYVMLESGDYIPVEPNGNYYYLSKGININENGITDINIENMMKYLNIIVLEEFSKTSPDYNELNNFIKEIVKVIPDMNNRSMITSHFNSMIGKVIKSTNDQNGTPSVLSARKNAYRGLSQQV